MYKLLNSKPKIHDLTKSSLVCYVEDIRDDTAVQFQTVSAERYGFTVYSVVHINVGDLILRGLDSGKIGVFEVRESIINGVSPAIGSPVDRHFLTVLFCGEMLSSTNLAIYNGYGIDTEEKPKLGKYKFMTSNGVSYTNDKILADFMNKDLSVIGRIKLWFM